MSTPRDNILTEVKQDLTALGVMNEDNEPKAEVYFKYALNFILDECNQDFTSEDGEELDEFPDVLKGVIAQMIIQRLNKEGSEGIEKEKLGDYSVSYSKKELPKNLLTQIYNHKVVRVT